MEKVRQHSENDNTYFTIEIEDGKFIDASDTKDGFAIQGDGLYVYDSEGNFMEYDVDVGEVMDCIQKPYDFQYRLLDRLKSDCDYWLGNGNHNDKYLWADSPDTQLEKMLNIYEDLPIKPEWLSREDIYKYADDMGVEGLKEYVEYRNQWMQEFMDDETLATTSVFYGAAKRDGEMSSSDTFADYITQHGFINSSAYLSFHNFKNSEYYIPHGVVYGISNTTSFVYVEDAIDPYLTLEPVIHKNDIFRIETTKESDRTIVTSLEHSFYSDKDKLGQQSPAGNMCTYKHPDCNIPSYSLDDILADYTPISQSQYEHLASFFKQMEQIAEERASLKDVISYINKHEGITIAEISEVFNDTKAYNIIESFNGSSTETLKHYLESHIAADHGNIQELYDDFLHDNIMKSNALELTKTASSKGKSSTERIDN